MNTTLESHFKTSNIRNEDNCTNMNSPLASACFIDHDLWISEARE